MLFTGTQSSEKYIKPIYGNVGKYTLSEGVELPYFVSSVSIERVMDELKIAEEYPADLENKWALTELYQREVDRERVKADMVAGYLSDPNKLKFFNALTVVLLPKSEEEKIVDKFEDSTAGDPPIPYDGNDPTDSLWNSTEAEKVNFGGVQFVRYGDQARLRWDENSVHAVVVDGQHRLQSLKEYKNTMTAFTTKIKQTKIPVIFVLISEKAGFVAKNDNASQSIRSMAREIFTDLNKNAKEVDKARELVLDDWSINAKCIRTLLTEETAKDSLDLIPLSLIRWQDSVIRFDSGYYLNSLVHLDQILTSILNIDYPVDPTDYKDVKSFVDSINQNLGCSNSSGSRSLNNKDHISLSEHLESEYVDGDEVIMPLKRLPASFLDAAVNGFEMHHKPYLIKVLTEFHPYKRLIEYSRENDLIEGSFGKFFSQTKNHQAQLRKKFQAENENWYLETIQNHIDVIEEFKISGKNQYWAYKAIFQKAIVELASEIAFTHSNENLNLGTVDTFIDYLNRVEEKGILIVEAEDESLNFPVWAFIATNPGDGKIKVNKTTLENLKAIIKLGYYISRHYSFNCGSITYPQAFQFMRSKRNSPEWAGCSEANKALFHAFHGKNGKKIFHGSERFDELSSDVIEKEVNDYVKATVKLLFVDNLNA
ncbi:MAG: hypothetical protein OIF51_00030 [Cellvibrionaceae bacterium]|nr:hypothetical protein [Cellvibrionaceae bacterium]